MLAVFVNVITVLLGSAIGILFRNKINKNLISAIVTALALVTITIGVINAIKTNDILCVIICLALGTLIGELIKVDDGIEKTGDFIKEKLLKGKEKNDSFSEGFVTACIVFCVGSMTITGSFEAGINGNYSIIYTKSALDFVTATAFSATMGIGVAFASLFVLVFQGGLTLLAELIAPYLSAVIVTEMSAIGGVILIGMGINMLNLKVDKIKVANMLPAIFLTLLYFPIYNLILSLI